METVLGITSLVANALLAIWGGWKRHQYKKVAAGAAVIVNVIEERKGTNDQPGPGRLITRAIKQHGADAVALVDKTLSAIIDQRYVHTKKEDARREHEKREKAWRDSH